MPERDFESRASTNSATGAASTYWAHISDGSRRVNHPGAGFRDYFASLRALSETAKRVNHIDKRDTQFVIKRLYDWTMGLAAHARASWALGGISFIESSVFPIPPDVLLIPMVLAKRQKAWAYAAICTITSVLGGILGYVIGLYLFEQLGEPLLAFYGYTEKFGIFQAKYEEWGAWAVFIAGITPFPYKVITILSGVAALDPVTFIIASILARGTRFFVVAALLWRFGEPIRTFIERRLQLLTIVFCALLVGGFVLVRFIL